MPEISWQIMISQVVTFLIAAAIVWIFGWKPIMQMIRDRQNKVRKTLEEAENTRLAITTLESEYRAKLDQVEQKSAELISIARLEAGRAREELMRAAQAEALELQKRAHEQIEHESRRVMQEMRSEVVGLSMAIAEKMLSRPLPEDVHDRKFQEMLEEISKGRRWGS